MAAELEFAFPVLSNPSLDVVYLYSMKGHGSTMADMGYVVIDAAGRVRVRQIDRRFGEHADEIVEHLRGMTEAKAGSAVSLARTTARPPRCWAAALLRTGSFTVPNSGWCSL